MAENKYHQKYQKTLTLIQDYGCKNAINMIKSKTIFLRIVSIGNFYIICINKAVEVRENVYLIIIFSMMSCRYSQI